MLVKVCFYERPLPIGKGLFIFAKKGGVEKIRKRFGKDEMFI
jgi:ribosomal protein L31